MVGLLLELLLQLGDLREGMLEPAVLEEHARMSRECLEELGVALVERAHVAGAVADDQQPERLVLPTERADHGIVEAAREDEGVERMPVTPTREQHRLPHRLRLRERARVVGRERLLRVHEQLARRPAHAAHRFASRRGGEQDFRVFGAQ